MMETTPSVHRAGPCGHLKSTPYSLKVTQLILADWAYLAKLIKTKTQTQIRTHAYSVFHRRHKGDGDDGGSRGNTPSKKSSSSRKRSSSRSRKRSSKGKQSKSAKSKQAKVHQQQQGQIVSNPYSYDEAMARALAEGKDNLQYERNPHDPVELAIARKLRKRAQTWVNYSSMFLAVAAALFERARIDNGTHVCTVLHRRTERPRGR